MPRVVGNNDVEGVGETSTRRQRKWIEGDPEQERTGKKAAKLRSN